MSKVAVIIPARDEEKALPLVLRDLPPNVIDRVIVVDNGSRDRTAAVARAAGAEVVSEPRPGYGRACLKGLAHLRAQPPEIVLFLDADHSDYPEEASLLLGPIDHDAADFVLGSRALGRREKGAMPGHARYGNRLICLLIRILFGHRYTDLGPMRAIRYSRLLELEMRDIGYGWTVELQIKAVRNRLRIREVPVSYRRRVGKSKGSGPISGSLGAGFKMLGVIARSLRLSG